MFREINPAFSKFRQKFNVKIKFYEAKILPADPAWPQSRQQFPLQETTQILNSRNAKFNKIFYLLIS